MAFQSNVQAPDLVGLALNLMQMKRDRELQERKLALEEQRMRFDQQQAALQAERDAVTFKLDVREREAALADSGIQRDTTQRTNEMGMGQTLDLVNDAKATDDQRYAAARQIDQFVQSQGSQFQRAPEMVGANLGAGRGLMLQKERLTEAVKEGDAARQDRWSIVAERRSEARTIAAEERAARRKQAEDEAAAAGGVYDNKGVAKLAASYHEERKEAYTQNRDWKVVDEADPNDKGDNYKMIQILQRKIDPATVREGDVAMWRAMGVDNWGAFAARAQKVATGNERFPAGFGEMLKRQLEGYMTAEDERINDLATGHERYVAENIRNPNQARAALPDQEAVDAVRARIADRENAANGGPPTDSEYARAERLLRRRGAKGKIDGAALNAEVQRMRSSATRAPSLAGGRPTVSGRMGGR